MSLRASVLNLTGAMVMNDGHSYSSHGESTSMELGIYIREDKLNINWAAHLQLCKIVHY